METAPKDGTKVLVAWNGFGSDGEYREVKIARYRHTKGWENGEFTSEKVEWAIDGFYHDPSKELLGWMPRSEEHTSELQSLMRISYAVFCLKKKNNHKQEYVLYILSK